VSRLPRPSDNAKKHAGRMIAHQAISWQPELSILAPLAILALYAAWIGDTTQMDLGRDCTPRRKLRLPIKQASAERGLVNKNITIDEFLVEYLY